NYLLNKCLVTPFLSDFKNTIINEIILIVFFIGLTIWLLVFSEVRFLRRLAVFIIFFYVLQLNQHCWIFLHMHAFSFMREWDIIVAGLSLPAFLTFILPRRVNKARETDKGFIEDLAIESS